VEENEGVMQGARLPQVKGLADLPPGLLVEESQFDNPPFGPKALRSAGLGEGRLGDFSQMFAEIDEIPDLREILGSDAPEANRQPRLPALDWLELEDELDKQDPDRLPTNPVDMSIAELEEAWGVHRRTNGQDRVAEDTDYRPYNAFRLQENNIDLDQARYEAQVSGDTPTRHRFSSKELRQVVQQAARRSASGEPLRSIFEEVVRELGDETHRVKRALEAIKESHGLVGRVYITASVYPGCHLGKWSKQVQKKAKTSRFVLACDKCSECMHNMKGVCKSFQRELVSTVPWDRALEIYAPRFAADGIRVASGDAREALRRAFATAPKENLPETEFQTHDQDSTRLDDRLRNAQYKDVRAALKEAMSRPGKKRAKKLASYFGKLVKANLLTPEEAQQILSEGGSESRMAKKVTAIVSHRHTVSRQFEDYGMRDVDGRRVRDQPTLTDTEQAILKAANDSGVRPREIQGILRWASVEMSEGHVGSDLDHLLQHRYASEVITAASPFLRTLRKKHEGLAGHLYVDAAAYDEQGVKGCDKGGLLHRTNGIPYVREMGKCAGCVFRNAHDTCLKYSKELVKDSDFSARELKAYKKDTLDLSKADDGARLAALFHQPENPLDEFGGLSSGVLEDFSFFPEGDVEPDIDVTKIGLGDGFDL
jgi:hypothetical protein